MTTFNKELTDTILQKCKNLSLDNQISKEDGRFLADKSYAFDTMFFVARYIQYFRFGDKFSRDNRDLENEYIADLFNLERGKAQIKNYFTEALAMLRFVGAMTHDGKDYRIIDEDILEILSSSFENAYIFMYLLTYSVLQNHRLWQLYLNFCKADYDAKQTAYDIFRAQYAKTDKRVKDRHKKWAMFTPKYPMVILNYANRQNMVSRTGVVSNKTVTRNDISLNTKGTRNNFDLPKKNAYLQDMSESYIIETLRPFLTYSPEIAPVSYSDSISIDIADTKLQMIAARQGIPVKRKSRGSRYRYVNGAKCRTVQSEFRNGLLQKTPHICPVCGFSYEDFLIASHIKPYAKCDDTYDAMNPNNGLLLCPVCDKLFESANLMTIDSMTGNVILAKAIEKSKDFQHLHGRTIDYKYIDCERRHYLKWHNRQFNEKQGLPEQKA